MLVACVTACADRSTGTTNDEAAVKPAAAAAPTASAAAPATSAVSAPTAAAATEATAASPAPAATPTRAAPAAASRTPPRKTPPGPGLSRTVSALDSLAGIGQLEGNCSITAEGPDGTNALRFEATQAKEDFSGRIDLAALGIDPHDYDLLKIDVKADNNAFLQFALENYPEPGDVSNWYPLDAIGRGSDWRTVWLDLKRPEEIEPNKATGPKPALLVSGAVRDLRWRMQGDSRCLRLRNLRLATKAIDLECDQTRAPYEWGPGQDLVYRYPVTVANRLDRPVTARLSLVPTQVMHAYARLSEPRVDLKPKESKTIEAEVRLPCNIAERMPPLYCERFEVRGFAEGIPDSETTIVRSKTYPLALTVTVPIAEENLQFPLLPRPKDLPVAITGFDAAARKRAEAAAAAASPDNLDRLLEAPMQRSFAFDQATRTFWYHAGDPPVKALTWRYLDGLSACAFLYDATGDSRYLDKGTAMLLRAAQLFQRDLAAWRKFPVIVGSHGILGGNTLALGWATGGFSAPFTLYRHGMFNDLDQLARDMDPRARETILRDLIVPAAVRMQQHVLYFNAQAVVDYPMLYAGLATRNWPLVSYAFSSERGIANLMQWSFDEEGCSLEGHYHASTIEPLLWAAELLHRQGVDLYDRRMGTILHSRSAQAAGYPYRGPIVDYVDAERFPREIVAEVTRPCDGLHLSSGLTLLRWKGLEVGMNWGKQLYRSCADRCALSVTVKDKSHPLAALMTQLGGGTYLHSSLQQSVIIIDESMQNPVSARVLGVDVDGPVQFVQATSDAHYPGTTITRTFAIVGPHAFAVDRATSKAFRTVDWMLMNAGPQVSLPGMKERPGGFTDKPDEPHASFGAKLHSPGHAIGTTGDTWTEGGGRLTMLGQAGTQVLTFRLPETWASSIEMQKAGKAALMVRRRGTAQTEFVACFSAASPTLERVPVKTAAGRDAQAVGVRVTPQGGQPFHVLVNFEPEGSEVVLGPLRTEDRLATDYRE
ncbi:MAG: hypothetical protein ACKOSQ_07150 [Planctomycetaceae bacterium]